MDAAIATALALTPVSTVGQRTVDITTLGARTQQPRRIEIWFHTIDGEVYITGTPPRARSWYANLLAHPEFTFHLKNGVQADLAATATQITDADERSAVLGAILGCGIQALLNPAQKTAPDGQVPKPDGAVLLDILDHLGRDFQNPAGLRVCDDLAQGHANGLPGARQRAALARAIAGVRAAFVVEMRFQRQRDAFHHGVEQLGLVLEMPVHSAARGARAQGNVLQGGA